MRRKPLANLRKTVRPRFRVYYGTEIAIGPGKEELLQAIEKTGSIHGAAVSLKMSYMRAWQLVRTMNSCFRSPLVETIRGGKHSGGAWLTPLGRRVLELYRRL
ncbi:MAG TPA: molybdenum transport protein, partial [Acidobacteriota bacterium]|nr:molybdenum transport protein [Acidobacteriota bacterium]